GGNIGLELAYAHPEKIKKLITFGANFTYENWLVTPDSVTMDSNDPKILRVSSMIQKYNTGKNKIAPEIGKKLTSLTEKYPNFTTDQLKQIKIPTLIVVGDHDLVALDQTVTLFKSLPHAQLFIVPGASHFELVEQPGLMISEITKFLSAQYRDIDPYYFTRFIHE
ncbi:MAG: alpha/beta hydrolase, partial [Bacteroidia bacterium]|nr:alpha/beta hydrolase [Bacteroidia bacterium]